MAMAWIFTAMIVISVVFGMVNGTMDAVSAAALSGANDAITLTISLLGVLCLWSGVLEVMDQSGLSNKLAAIFRPLLRKIFPDASADPVTLSAISSEMQPHPWASRRPGVWRVAATAPRPTVCAALSCSIPLPSN